MELFVWPSDFTLPSVDPLSLQFMAAVKMCAAPVHMKRITTPTSTPAKMIPFFQHVQPNGPHTQLTDFDEFSQYLREQIPGLALDSHLSEEARSSIPSYLAYLSEKLYPAYMAVGWADHANFNTITNRWYCRTIGLPTCWWIQGNRRNDARCYLRQIYTGTLVTDEEIIFDTTREAIACINSLSIKLGNKKYLFGDKPTSVDAKAFGFLAYFLKTPFPNDTIQRHIKGCLNLVRYVESIISIYLPLTSEELEKQRHDLGEWERARMDVQADVETARKEGGSEDEYPTRNKVMFGVSAAILAVLASFYFGIIRVVSVEKIYDNDGQSLPTDAEFETD